MPGRAAVEIGIVSTDAASLEPFYVQGLGFEVEATFTFERGSLRRLKRDDARCKIFEPVAPPSHQGGGPIGSRAGIAYAALHVADLEPEVAAVLAAGGSLIEGPVAHRPGARYALIADPDGNVWELLEERPVP